MNDTAQPGGNAVPPNRRIHSHVVLSHFPISFFLLTLGFIAVRLASGSACFELAALVSLVAGAAATVPTAVSGWFTWKNRYEGRKGRIFTWKIRTAFAMNALCLILLALPLLFPDATPSTWLWIFTLGTLLLVAGASIEGYYGGTLNHR